MAIATFGVVERDVLCRREVRILHSRAGMSATTAIARALRYLAARKVGLDAVGRVGLGVAIAVGLHAWDWNHGVLLPVWETETEKN